MSSNPYAAPAARVADEPEAGAAPALWNPNAAASWCVLFTPAFGSYLHMLNWRALGDAAKARAQKTWFVVSLAAIALYVVLSLVALWAPAAGGVSNLVGLVLLLSWYFASARPKERFGNDYPRRAWGKPLLVAAGCSVGYVVLLMIVGVVIGVAGGK